MRLHVVGGCTRHHSSSQLCTTWGDTSTAWLSIAAPGTKGVPAIATALTTEVDWPVEPEVSVLDLI